VCSGEDRSHRRREDIRSLNEIAQNTQADLLAFLG
jgi:hypothetical protein